MISNTIAIKTRHRLLDGDKHHSKAFARRCLISYLAGGTLSQYTIDKSLEVLQIPSNLTLKEKLSYFQLIEMDKNES